MVDTVSILIPAYNVQEFIGQCLSSIIEQTYNNIEIIIVNDGSNDNTLDICRRFSLKDSRIKLITQTNTGVASARNRALAEATGDYILFVDSDDWIEKDMIEILVKVLKSNPKAGIVFCKNDFANSPQEILRAQDNHRQEVWDTNKQVYEFLSHKRLTGSLVTKLIRKELCQDVYFDTEVGYGEDAQWLWKIIKKTRDMVVIDETLYHYVMEEKSISHQKYSSKKFSSIKVWREIEVDVLKNYPRWKDKVKERLLASATYLCFEMKQGGVLYKDEKKELRKVVRDTFGIILKKNELSLKMRLYALLVAIGF